jgi:hypothetical protein
MGLVRVADHWNPLSAALAVQRELEFLSQRVLRLYRGSHVSGEHRCQAWKRDLAASRPRLTGLRSLRKYIAQQGSSDRRLGLSCDMFHCLDY